MTMTEVQVEEKYNLTADDVENDSEVLAENSIWLNSVIGYKKKEKRRYYNIEMYG